MEEAEAAAELSTAGLDGPPDGFIPGVVVDHQDFKVRVVQSGQCVEGLDDHGRRLVIAGHVDGHLGQRLAGGPGRALEEARPARAPLGFCPFMGLRQEHGQHARGPEQHENADDHRRHRHVLLGVLVKHPDDQRAGGIGHQGQKTTPEVSKLAATYREDGQHQDSEADGHRGQHPPFGDPDDIGCEGKLGLPFHVVNAPVGTHGTLALGLPGLVEGFHQVVDVALFGSPGEKAAQEHGFIGIGRDGGFPRAAVAGPAHLGEHDGLAGEGFLQQRDLVVDVADGGLGRDSFPVGQHVDGEVVHVVSQLRVTHPDVPGLRRAHGFLDRLAYLIQVGRQFRDRDIAPEHHLVADDYPDHIGVLPGQADGLLDFGGVVGGTGVDPGPEGHLDAMIPGQFRDHPHGAVSGVSPHGPGMALQQGQVFVDLLDGGEIARHGILPGPVGGKGKALNAFGPGGLGDGPVGQSPERNRGRTKSHRNQQTGNSHGFPTRRAPRGRLPVGRVL